MLYNGMKSEVIIHANDPTLDGAFQVNTYPVIQLFFELVPNNSEFLSLPESSSRRIQNHRLQTECIQEARARVWNQHKADTYIKRYGTDTEDEDNDDTSSAGGYMSDADPYRYNCLQAGDYVLYYDRVNYREECRGWISSINEERQNVGVQIEGTIDSLQFGDHIKVLCRQAADTTLRRVEVPFWETISSRTTIGRHTYTTGVVSRRNKGLRESMANAEKDIQDFNGVG
jgi:hypothetical protein